MRKQSLPVLFIVSCASVSSVIYDTQAFGKSFGEKKDVFHRNTPSSRLRASNCNEVDNNDEPIAGLYSRLHKAIHHPAVVSPPRIASTSPEI